MCICNVNSITHYNFTVDHPVSRFLACLDNLNLNIFWTGIAFMDGWTTIGKVNRYRI